MKTEKTESRKIETEKNVFRKKHIYIYTYIYNCPPPPIAFMYLCKPIASAQNPPVIKKKKKERKKWAPQSPRYSSNTAGEYPCKHCNFFLM